MTDQERPEEPLPSEILPHHASNDIPGALAHVRVMNRYFAEVYRMEIIPATVAAALHILYMDVLAEVLEPFAVDLALSLAALEDSPRPEP